MAVKTNKCEDCDVFPIINRRFDSYIIQCPKCQSGFIENTIPKAIRKWNSKNRVIGGKNVDD